MAAAKTGKTAPHMPTDEQRKMVEEMAGFGIPQDRIMQVIGITLPTLHRHYRKELDRGAARVEANLIGNLFRIAQGNSGTALKAIMFSLQARFGWTRYAPFRAPAPGKKEQAQRGAETCHQGTTWADILKLN